MATGAQRLAKSMLDAGAGHGLCYRARNADGRGAVPRRGRWVEPKPFGTDNEGMDGQIRADWRRIVSTDLVRDLVNSGIHFGHQASRWNPKMGPYIFGKRNSIHIIDVKETLKGLLRAKRFISRVVAEGKDVLLVGTKRQARKIVQEVAEQTGMHYVNDRWLGGTLTNYRTIRSRLARLEELERMETEGTMDAYSKKQAAANRRELRKIRRNLGGIRSMERLPGALFLVDQRREINAVREAQKLGIPTVCLLDTDSDPDMVDLPIPGNDDAMRAIELVVREIGAAVAEGKAGRAQRGEVEGGPHRRSRRPVTARAGAESAEDQPGAGAAAPQPEAAGQEAPAPEQAPVQKQAEA